MQVTFLIGNGFDLACGLKTKYEHVYEKYCIQPSRNETIQNFKEQIRQETLLEEIPNNKNGINWSDFEMALPKFGKQINDFDKFQECVLDFLSYLEDYLREEENKINVDSHKNALSEKMQRYIYYFYDFCLQDSKSVLKRIVEETADNVVCNFITFNYTNTLEKCLSSINKRIRKRNPYEYIYKDPIHIHRELYNGIILGLDKEELYKDIPCPDIRRLKNLIDKIHINERYSDITTNVVNILKASRVIVIFGWSMGESDSFWVETLKKLILENTNLHLVYVPYYKEGLNRRYRNQALDREDEQKDIILNKFDIPEENRNRVHIVTDTEYMNLKFLVNSKSGDKILVTV